MPPPNVLLCYVARPMCVGIFFRYGFIQAGCHVRSAGPMQPTVWEHSFPEEDRQGHWYQGLPDGPVALGNLLEQIKGVDGWQPELVVMIDQFDQFHLVGDAPCKFTWVAVENWEQIQGARAATRKTDAEYHMIAHTGRTVFDAQGWPYPAPDTQPHPPVPEGSEWMPFAFDPSVHAMLDIPRTRWACQIGTGYTPRPRVWNHLRAVFDAAPGVDDRAYLNGLHETEHTAFGRALSHWQNAMAYNSSLTALSSSNTDFFPMRGFEAPAMGCIFVSDRYPAIERLLGPPYPENPLGLWVEHDRSAEGHERAVRFVVEMPAGHRQALQVRAIANAYSFHTYAHRARQILARAGLRGMCHAAV